MINIVGIYDIFTAKTLMAKLYLILIQISILVSCGSALEFKSETGRISDGTHQELKASSDNDMPQSIDAEDNSAGSQEPDDVEENVVASVPTVISGSYLTCLFEDFEKDLVFCKTDSVSQDISFKAYSKVSDRNQWTSLTLDVKSNSSWLFFGDKKTKRESGIRIQLTVTGISDWYILAFNPVTSGLDLIPTEPLDLSLLADAPASQKQDDVTPNTTEPKKNEASGDDDSKDESEESVETPLVREFQALQSLHLGNGQWPLGTRDCEDLEKNKTVLFGSNYSLVMELTDQSKLTSLSVGLMCGLDSVGNEIRIYDERNNLIKTFPLNPGSKSFDGDLSDLPVGKYVLMIYSTPFDEFGRRIGEDDFLLKNIKINYSGSVDFGTPFVW